MFNSWVKVVFGSGSSFFLTSADFAISWVWYKKPVQRWGLSQKEIELVALYINKTKGSDCKSLEWLLITKPNDWVDIRECVFKTACKGSCHYVQRDRNFLNFLKRNGVRSILSQWSITSVSHYKVKEGKWSASNPSRSLHQRGLL